MKLAIDDLVITKENPRTTRASEAGHKALVASMSTHGLIQPMVVRPNGTPGKYEVIAGSRRLAAAKELGWTEIECVENDAEFGVAELGAAENMMREAMHPLDECAVISRLVSDGESVETIAGRFGQTEKWVDQRIKLNGLCPEVQRAFRGGLITMAAAQAFTLADKKDQKDYLVSAKDWQLEASNIARHFHNKSIPAKYALFPIASYPKASIVTDLFGDDVWLTDRAEFDRLQKQEIANLKIQLTDVEGWGECLVLLTGPDSRITGKYAKVEGRILKADRGKQVAMIVYHPGSGSCDIARGFVLRTDAKAIKKGAAPENDTVGSDEIVAHDADTLSTTQLQIVGALQTNAIELAISEGDVHMALMTLCGPLLSWDRLNNPVPWSASRPNCPDYKAANTMLEDKLESYDDGDARYHLPSRASLGDMTVNDLAPLLCNVALRCLNMLPGPSPTALKALKAADIQWMGFDEGFLKRYRTDALEDLADRLKLEHDGLSKTELVKMIVSACKDRDVDRVIDFEAAASAKS